MKSDGMNKKKNSQESTFAPKSRSARNSPKFRLPTNPSHSHSPAFLSCQFCNVVPLPKNNGKSGSHFKNSYETTEDDHDASKACVCQPRTSLEPQKSSDAHFWTQIENFPPKSGNFIQHSSIFNTEKKRGTNP